MVIESKYSVPYTVENPLMTQFWVHKNCVTAEVSEEFCAAPLVKQLSINFIKFATSFHP